MIVLDTHVVIWSYLAPDKISRSAWDAIRVWIMRGTPSPTCFSRSPIQDDR